MTETAGLALRAARLLSLLTVLGLLAMHGAAHGEHAAAATHPVTVVQSADGQHGPVHLGLPATSDRAVSGEPDSDGPGALTALCLTVLMSAAVVLAVRSLLRHRRRRADGAWSPFLVAAVRARPDPPPPDPVRELCISRT